MTPSWVHDSLLGHGVYFPLGHGVDSPLGYGAHEGLTSWVWCT